MIPLKLAKENPIKPAKPIKVGLVQLNNSFSDQYYLPLSVGMLQAYAQKHLAYSKDYEFALPIFNFMPVEEASEMLSDCDIVGFSCYVWNEQNSLAIAKDYNRRNPKGIVIFGGPQVPDSKKQFRPDRTVELNADELKRKRIHFTEDFHRAHSFIDIACHGESERVFKMILEQMARDGCRDLSRIPSISFMDAAGGFHYNNKIERMKDEELAQTPSPFTSGVFDKLMDAHPDKKWIKMYETNRGCPYACRYCDWGGATEDRISKFPMEQIYADIMWAGEHRIPYEFLCDANFGLLVRDIQVAEFFAESKAKYGFPEGVSTQNAKNPKPHTLRALKILEKAGLNKATVMSQQSLNPATLKAVGRSNMKMDEYYDIQKQLAAQGVYTMTDIILPMPEETYESIISAISTLIKNGQHNRIQFNNLSILRNTEMGNPEYQEHFGYEIVRTKIINIHGKKNDSISGIEEYQELVVATKSMPPEMWMKSRTLCWGTGLFYFNKLLQIPMIVLYKEYGMDYGEILHLLCEKFRDYGRFPIFEEIRDLFIQMAKGMRRGREEYIHAPQWLDIWWPPEEYALIKLCVEDKFADFYREAEEVLSQFLAQKGKNISAQLLRDCITLNQLLIKIPFQKEDVEIHLNYNILGFYHGILTGKEVPLQNASCSYVIDRTSETWQSWDDWCRKMVWYGNRKGAYLYGTKVAGVELAGHH